MYLSRAVIRTDSAELGLLARIAAEDFYRAHQLVWRLFADQPDRRRDFLYRRDTIRGRPGFFVLSERRPKADPAVWEIETREFQPRLEIGDRLAFSLRVNPVVTRPNEKGGGSRHDIVMDAKKRLGKEAWESRYSQDQLTRLAEEWLRPRSQRLGFAVKSLVAEGYRQHSHARKGTKEIKFSTLDLSGALVVEDLDTFFNEALKNGIGPAKAFGCGLLLVRRI